MNAALLLPNYLLDELKNDITRETPGVAHEPSIDYVVTKIPRFAFEKFPQAAFRRSVRSEIFVATRATEFPSPVGAAYSAPDGA